MSSETSRPLGDYVTLTRGTTYKGNLVGTPGPALLGLGAITPGGGFRDGDFKTYGGECPEKLMLRPGDLFAALKGATKDGKMIGSVARVPDFVPLGRLTQDTVRLDFSDLNEATRNYIYWTLRTPQYRDYCAGRAMGSAVVALSRDDFLSYPVPPLTDYRAYLVDLLQDIERRSSLMRDINMSLDALAHALFKSWFVDFDPVRAKQEGRLLEGMDEATAALFPDSFDESLLGSIPSGWRAGAVGDFAHQKKGSVSPLNSPETLFEHYSLPAFDNGQAPIIEAGLEIKSNKTPLPPEAVLLSKLNPHIPRVWLPVKHGTNAVCSTEFLAFTPHGDGSKEFIYCFFSSPSFLQRLCQVVTGTSNSHQRVKPDQVSTFPCVVPPVAVLDAFTAVVRPMFACVYENRMHAQTLATIQGNLLSRLISGQLPHPSAIEEAVELLTGT